MKETEVKILEVDSEKVAAKLAEFGAVKVFEGDLLTVFLDFQDNRISKRRDVLRLRKEGDNAELTYKKIETNKAVKEAQECSVQVSDLDETQEILQHIGLKVTAKMRKHRVSYTLGSVRFDIDHFINDFQFIPEFLEIEGSKEEIQKYAQTLGFQEKDCLPWSTDELIQHYSSKKR